MQLGAANIYKSQGAFNDDVKLFGLCVQLYFLLLCYCPLQNLLW